MKNLRACLVAAATAAALLAGCGSADDSTAPATEAPPTEATTEVTTGAEERPADDGAADGAAGGTQPATVALSFDEQPVPIALACNGADGAVLVTTEGEVTVTLVQEEGTALRYNGEGMTAETTDVTVEQIGESTVYRATLQSEEVPAVDVTLELGDTSVLEECEA